MTQAARLRALDARFMRSFLRAGLADSAIYTAPGQTAGSVPNCTVMIDRQVAVLGEVGEVIGYRVGVTFQRTEVAPAVGGTLTIGAEMWKLEKKISEDESFSEWVLNG